MLGPEKRWVKKMWSDNILGLKILKSDWSEKNLSLKNSATETCSPKILSQKNNLGLNENLG